MSTSEVPLLVRPETAGSDERLHWDGAARRALDHDGGLLRILGGPGTGKTTLLAEVAVDRLLRSGSSSQDLLVLTGNRTNAALMRSTINRRLRARRAAPTTGGGPLVRTVHSYAFGVLRLQAARDERPAPQLLNGPDQDMRIRDLLNGDIEDGARDWPESLRAALNTDGFVAELRDLLMRASERGVGPALLADLGERHGRPEWIAAGRFGLQYERVTMLHGSGGVAEDTAPPLDAAELVASAVRAFEADPALLAAERSRVGHLLVDDAQNLDPQQYRLCERIGGSATEFLLAGDPDQAVFSFRGADASGLAEADPTGDRTAVLTTGHRMSPRVLAAAGRLAARLPGAGAQRELFGTVPGTPKREQSEPDGAEPDGAGPDDSEPREGEPGGSDVHGHDSVLVRLHATQPQQAAWVADRLRRAHLLDGVPWTEMAVIVRSTGLSLPVLRRSLLAAGVPVVLPVDEVPLARRPAVVPLLTLLRCAARPEALDADTAELLLTSSYGGADALALRRLRRELRRLDLAAGNDRSSGDLLVRALLDDDRLTALETTAAAPARRIASLLRTGSRACAENKSVEETLWQVWKAGGQEQRLLARAERGGVAGAQADRDLDAVVALFDAAARYGDERPGADAAAFADHLAGRQIAGSTSAPTAPAGDAVSVLTAHAAAGREWEVVAIPDVQEGIWPDLRSRGSLLGVDRLIDVLAGVGPSERVSASAPLLAEERRLLLLALSRARRTVLLGAVRGEDEQPSRFLDELEGVYGESDADERPLLRPQRGLSLPELVGELRRVVCDRDYEASRRESAAAQLARLAAAGVPGAHPDSWYGLPESSSSAPLVAPGEPVRVSPSTVQVLSTCPLRWMIERHGGQDAAELASVTGTLVHALVQSAAEGADAERLRRALDRAWESVDAGAPWFARKERARVEGMLEAFLVWLRESRGELTQLGVERDLDLKIPAREGGPGLRLRGRVDRLETDSDGHPVVVDVKTSKSTVSRHDAQQHPQLAVYQLAATLGAFGDVAPGGAADDTGDGDAAPVEAGGGVRPGGARLLYVAKPDASGAATERGQPALDEEHIRVWLDVVHDAADSAVGPEFTANENADCPRCPVRSSCPVHPAGRQVGR